MEKVKNSWQRSIDWAKNVQVYIALMSFAFTLVGMLFLAGKSYAQMSTKSDVEALKAEDKAISARIDGVKKEVAADVYANLKDRQDQQHREIIGILTLIQKDIQAQAETTKEISATTSETKGQVSVLIEDYRKRK